MPKATILVVNYKHKAGGYSHRLQMKIQAYLEQGWHVHYIAVKRYPYSHPNLTAHIMWLPFKKHDTPWFWAAFFLSAPLYTLLKGKKIKPDLISVFSPPYAWVCGLLKKFLKIPIILFLRTTPNDPLYSYQQADWANKIEHQLNEKGMLLADLAIANSETVKKATQERYTDFQQQIEVIPNHLPLLKFDKRAARIKIQTTFRLKVTDFVIVTTGRFHKGKNIEILLAALSRLENDNIKLLLLGDGEETGYLKSRAKEMQVDSRVVFSGWRKDVTSLLPGANLFVLPSLKEGMSNSLLEAMACDVPCIISDIPENCEVITRHDQQFSPQDAERLAYIIRRAVEEKYFYNEMCKHTKGDADRFRFNWKARVVKAVSTLLPSR